MIKALSTPEGFWKFIGYIILTAASLVIFNMWQANTERKIDSLQRLIWHQSETSHAFGISALKTSALTLEQELLTTREEKRRLVQCIMENTCRKHPEWLVERELPRYESPTEIYNGLQKDLSTKFEEIEDTSTPVSSGNKE